jgi:acylphosphatase
MSGASRAAFRAVVSGRVQGVYFRAFTADRARALGLAGTVRNGADGRTVHVYAEGERPALELLLEQLRTGPSFARVDAVDVEWVATEGTYSGFTIAS